MIESPLSALQTARSMLRVNHDRGLAALNDLFRRGRLPDPSPDGRYHGELIALDIAPGLTALFTGLAGLWMPWRGKTFDASHRRGENVFTESSYPLARLFNPRYRGFHPDDRGVYRAFAFRTYAAPGLADPDRLVLKIDYNLEENPALTVQRVLDELVQLDDRLYMGKAHLRWWWSPAGRWQTAAFFSLIPEMAPTQ